VHPNTVQNGTAGNMQRVSPSVGRHPPDGRCCLSSIGLFTTPVSEASLLPSLAWLPRAPWRMLPPSPASGAVPSLRVEWSRTARMTLDVVMALVRGPA
jgi:hypothetical protein